MFLFQALPIDHPLRLWKLLAGSRTHPEPRASGYHSSPSGHPQPAPTLLPGEGVHNRRIAVQSMLYIGRIKKKKTGKIKCPTSSATPCFCGSSWSTGQAQDLRQGTDREGRAGCSKLLSQPGTGPPQAVLEDSTGRSGRLELFRLQTRARLPGRPLYAQT